VNGDLLGAKTRMLFFQFITYDLASIAKVVDIKPFINQNIISTLQAFAWPKYVVGN
jgi:hypothetical protein